MSHALLLIYDIFLVGGLALTVAFIQAARGKYGR